MVWLERMLPPSSMIAYLLNAMAMAPRYLRPAASVSRCTAPEAEMSAGESEALPEGWLWMNQTSEAPGVLAAVPMRMPGLKPAEVGPPTWWRAIWIGRPFWSVMSRTMFSWGYLRRPETTCAASSIVRTNSTPLGTSATWRCSTKVESLPSMLNTFRSSKGASPVGLTVGSGAGGAFFGLRLRE